MLEVVEVIAANVFKVLEGSLVLLVSGLASIALHKLSVKFHLQNEAQLKEGLDFALNKAVHGAEAWADKHDTAPSGNEKMDEAIKIARMLLTNESFKNFTDGQLKKLIEAALSQQINTPAPVAAPAADAITIAKEVKRELAK